MRYTGQAGINTGLYGGAATSFAGGIPVWNDMFLFDKQDTVTGPFLSDAVGPDDKYTTQYNRILQQRGQTVADEWLGGMRNFLPYEGFIDDFRISELPDVIRNQIKSAYLRPTIDKPTDAPGAAAAAPAAGIAPAAP